MGRLTLIILVLFSVTAIYSEANAAAAPAADVGTTWHNLQAPPGPGALRSPSALSVND